MPDRPIIAWALVSGTGKVFINTVHDTERGAMVNALVTELGQGVYNSDTDEDIRNMFDRLAVLGMVIIQVSVEVLDGKPDPNDYI